MADLKTIERQARRYIDLIDTTIDKFLTGVPEGQKRALDEILTLVKSIELSEGNIRNNRANIKLLSEVRRKLQKAIINPTYVRDTREYLASFDKVTKLQEGYFKELIRGYDPPGALALIKEAAVGSTIDSLLEAGVTENVVKPVENLLRTNITTGGNYLDLLDELRTEIVGTEDLDGGLLRYTRQIATDALNQYSANYNHTVTEDLGLVWYMYLGSLLRTSRPFCIECTAKKWIHADEIPTILTGSINGRQVPIYSKTGLPYGLIPGTNPSNFKIRRGGYNCGHQLIPVSPELVPEEIRNAHAQGEAPPAPPPPPGTTGRPPIVKPKGKRKPTPKKPPTKNLPKVPGFTPVESRREANKRIREMYKDSYGIEVKTITYDKSVDLDQLNEYLEQLTRLVNEYKTGYNPSTINIRFKSTSSSYGYLTPGNTGTYAEGNREIGGKIININYGHRTSALRASDKRNEILDAGRLPGKSSADPDKYKVATVTHEFAHSITITEHRRRVGRVPTDANNELRKFWDELEGIRGDYKKELRKILDDSGARTWTEALKNEEIRSNFKDIYLGNYASTNLDEFYAEAFTEYKLSTTPSKYAKLVGELTDKYFLK